MPSWQYALKGFLWMFTALRGFCTQLLLWSFTHFFVRRITLCSVGHALIVFTEAVKQKIQLWGKILNALSMLTSNSFVLKWKCVVSMLSSLSLFSQGGSHLVISSMPASLQVLFASTVSRSSWFCSDNLTSPHPLLLSTTSIGTLLTGNHRETKMVLTKPYWLLSTSL